MTYISYREISSINSVPWQPPAALVRLPLPTKVALNICPLPAWHVRLKPYYEQPQISETPVIKEELTELVGVKHEPGSGSEKENTEARNEKKRKRTLSSSSEDNVDPDFSPTTPGKSTSTKSNEMKREHKDKEKRREKEKKKKKDKDRDRDRERGQERSKEEKMKSSHNNGIKEKTQDTPKKEKSDKPDSKITFKVAEPQSFEKLITETAGSVNGAGGAKKSLEERRNMSQLFPGQMKAESIKKKLALTPHSSPKHSSSSSSSSQHKTPLKSSDSHHSKKQSDSPVKKILNFDNPSKNVNILDQIMSNMSFPVNKE